MDQLVSLLGYLDCAVFAFTALNWMWAVENRRPSEDASFLWDTGAAFDETRFTHFGRKYRRRFVGGMGCFIGILVVMVALQVVPATLA